MIDFSTFSFELTVGVFVAAALAIGVAGAKMSATADRLADITGMGEAIFGALLLGGSTSISGIVTSVVTAYEGYPELAISNAAGGIAAQTAFLGIADTVYRQANLEHAAASIENLMNGVLLSLLLAVPLFAMAAPPFSVLGVNPASVLLVLAYGFSMRLIADAQTAPLWTPEMTDETRLDEPDQAQREHYSLRVQWLQFAALAAIVGVAGYFVGQTGIAIAEQTVLSETIVGGLLTAVATSLPELVTSIAAVRQGALTLAVGGVIGGNSFDVLFVAFSDVAYRQDSIYHAITDRQVFMFSLAIILTGVLLLGLLRREKTGIANIGFESFLVILIYTGSFLLLYIGG